MDALASGFTYGLNGLTGFADSAFCSGDLNGVWIFAPFNREVSSSGVILTFDLSTDIPLFLGIVNFGAEGVVGAEVCSCVFFGIVNFGGAGAGVGTLAGSGVLPEIFCLILLISNNFAILYISSKRIKHRGNTC